MGGIAVLDVETTGLRRSDRIVEVGVVLLDEHGAVESTTETLVNPCRDVGPTSIHRISPRDLTAAPEFADIAEHLRDLLTGRVLAAHNAWFDLSFLAREFLRSGLSLPAEVPTICTMQMSRQVCGVGTLADACSVLSIPLHHHHSALADAQAAAEVFNRIQAVTANHPHQPGAYRFVWNGETGRLVPVHSTFSDLQQAAAATWPQPARPAPPPRLHTRQSAHHLSRQHDHLLAHAVQQRPPGNEDPEVSIPYLTLLVEVLRDRDIADHEVEQLCHLMAVLGLSRQTVLATHFAFLHQNVTSVMLDDVVTPGEYADLQRLAELLGLPANEVPTAISAARRQRLGCCADPSATAPGLADHPQHRASLTTAAQPGPTVDSFALNPGDRIAFTGQMDTPRADLNALAAAAGLIPGSVTKATAALVVADAQSQSGKARKARQYGIPVIAEQEFMHLVQRITATAHHQVSTFKMSR